MGDIKTFFAMKYGTKKAQFFLIYAKTMSSQAYVCPYIIIPKAETNEKRLFYSNIFQSHNAVILLKMGYIYHNYTIFF